MIYQSKTKEESRALIDRLRLNSPPEIFVKKTDDEKIVGFFKENKADLYVIRHADKTNAHYEYVKNYSEFLKICDCFSENIIVAVSVGSYKKKVLLGAIEWRGNTVRICATEKEWLDHRTMYCGEAEFGFEADICDKKLESVPQIDFLLQYIFQHHLQGLTVEFTIYDRPVGKYHEKILINELRNY